MSRFLKLFPKLPLHPLVKKKYDYSYLVPYLPVTPTFLVRLVILAYEFVMNRYGGRDGENDAVDLRIRCFGGFFVVLARLTRKPYLQSSEVSHVIALVAS